MAGSEQNHPEEGLSRRRAIRAGAGIGALLLAAIAWYGIAIEPNSVQRSDIRIRIDDLPDAFEGYRILHLSDFEAASPGIREEQVEAIARATRPDLIAVTGDLVQKGLTGIDREIALSRMAAWLGSLPAPDGIWFVEGHGEAAVRRGEVRWAEMLEQEGIHGLWDDVTMVRRGGAEIALIGIRVHDYGGEGRWIKGDPGRIRQEPGSRPGYLELVCDGVYERADDEITGRLRFESPGDWVGVLAHSRLGVGEERLYMALRREGLPFLSASARGTTYTGGVMAWARAMAPGRWYRFRLEIEASEEAVRMRARAWEDGLEEPSGWDVDYTDAGPERIRSGALGIYAEGPGEKFFEDLDTTACGGEGAWREPPGADFLMGLLARVPKETPVILLSHTPDIFPDAAELGIPLVLAGHTQGGQVNLPGFGPLVTDTRLGRRYAAGLYSRGRSHLFITRGIGTTRIPVRFMSPPGADLITLSRSAS